MISTIALIVSMAALAVCILAAASSVLSDGLKGLKKRGKLIGAAFLIYGLTFLVFLIAQ